MINIRFILQTKAVEMISSVIKSLDKGLAKSNSLFSWLLLVTSLVLLFAKALIVGGRWDLYEPIAMADRWPNIGYSSGFADGYIASTPYFPGVSLISFFVKNLSPQFQVEILLFLAVLMIFILQFALFPLYRKIGGLRDKVTYVAISLILSFSLLKNWLAYASEFKPDTIALCFIGLSLRFVLEPISSKLRFFLITAAIFFALLFKQQIIASIVGIGVGILISRQSLRSKFFDICAIAFGSLLALSFIFFCFEGSFFFAVKAHIGRSFVNQLFDHAGNKLFLSMSLIAIFGFIFNQKCQKIFSFPSYVMAALLWLAISIVSAINNGGNIGNSNAGFLLLLPFLVMSLDIIRPALVTCAIIIFCIINIHSIEKKNYWNLYKARIETESSLSNMLVEHKVNHVLISGDSYIAARNAKIAKVSEIDSWVHIKSGIAKNLVSESAGDLLLDLNPDAIMCIQKCSAFEDFQTFTPTSLGYKEVVKDTLFIKK